MTGNSERPKNTQTKVSAFVDHDTAIIAELRNDPHYAEIYLQAAFEEIYEPGGVSAFLIALRQVIESRGGVSVIAEKAGISRQHLYRALSENGNPTIGTLTAVTRAAGVRMSSSAQRG